MKFNSDSSNYIILSTFLVHLCSVEKLNKVELNWIEFGSAFQRHGAAALNDLIILIINSI